MTGWSKQFGAVLDKSLDQGGWSYLVMPGSAGYFGTRGLVKVRGLGDGRPSRSAFMAPGDGRRKLPVKSGLRDVIGKKPGDRVTVVLQRRPDRGDG